MVEQTGLNIRSPLDRPDEADDYEVGPVGRPRDEMARIWDLATRRWMAEKYEQRRGIDQTLGSSQARRGIHEAARMAKRPITVQLSREPDTNRDAGHASLT